MAKESERAFYDASSGMKPPKKPARTGLKTLLLTALLMTAALVIIHETILQITTVTVVGNKSISREEILHLSGFDQRVGYLSIRESEIRERLNAHPRLEFEKLEKQFPSSVTIYVKERVPCANLVLLSSQYLLDSDGNILEKCDSNLSNGFPCITGLNVKRFAVGEQVIPVNFRQLDAYCQVMKELDVQKCTGEFSELNVADAENIYLVSLDGYSIRLGTEKDMRAKIFTVRGSLRHLRENGYKPGGLDASVPGYATYTPPNL